MSRTTVCALTEATDQRVRSPVAEVMTDGTEPQGGLMQTGNETSLRLIADIKYQQNSWQARQSRPGVAQELQGHGTHLAHSFAVVVGNVGQLLVSMLQMQKGIRGNIAQLTAQQPRHHHYHCPLSL